MAAGPIYFGMWSGTGGQVRGRTLARARARARDRTSGRTAEIAVFPLLGAVPEFSVGLPPSGIDEGGAPEGEGLVDALERLAALRERGDLNAEAYAAAKRRLLDDEAPG
jgi:hypothetical protein